MRALLFLTSLLVACSGDTAPPSGSLDAPGPHAPTSSTTEPTAPATKAPTEPPDPGVATAEALYDPDHVAIVSIGIAAQDAERLAAETNDLFQLLEGADCLDSPWSGPFNWYVADVEVDGALMPLSGIRKKGLIGSLSSEKPSLKVDFDKWVDGQSYQGLERLTLNNSVSDGTLVKQCLGYQLFRDAGLPAPRCSFANVSVNGDPLGVYVNVEPLKKDFLRWAFDGDDDGDLYEGTLSDFRSGWTSTFEADTQSTDPDLGPILAVQAALEIEDDDAMLAALEQVLDVDQFFRFWAMEVLIGHVDGYAGNTNNFYVYRPEASEQLVFLPWGIDSIFWDTESFGSDTTQVTLNNAAIPRRLWSIPEQRQRYYDTLQDLLDTVWDEGALLGAIDRMERLTAPYVLPDDGRRDRELDDLRAFIATRRADLEAAMSAEAPTFDTPLREGICLVESGDLWVEFDTTWGTLNSKDPLGEGIGWLMGERDGEPLDAFGGAIAGDEEGMTSIAGVALVGPTVLSYAVVQLPTELVQEGAHIPIDGMGAIILLAEIDFAVSEEATIVGSVWGGELVIDQYTGVEGGPIAGHFEGPLYGGGPF